MLKIIVSKPGPFASTDFSKYESLINDSVADGHKVCSIMYLHGKVEDVMGYDIGACLNGEECADFEKGKYKEGIYDVEIVDYPNICKAFLWNSTESRRGLIVDPKDEKDLKFAQEKYNNKVSIL